MRKSEEIIGLPVISIEEGDEIGVIEHVIPNVINGSVAGLALKREVWYQQPLVIPFSFVVSMSSEALTIENKSAVYPLSQLTELEEMLASGNEIIGLVVITKSGEILGRVTEYRIDDAGCITEYLLQESQESISQEQVLTLGKKLLVVDASVRLHKPARVQAPENTRQPRAEAAEATTLPNTSPSPEPPGSEAERLRQMVSDKQEKSIVGRPCGRTIMSESGAPIIRKGEEVTTEVMSKAKKADRFSELVESTRTLQS